MKLEENKEYIYTEWDKKQNKCNVIYKGTIITDDGFMGYKFKHKNSDAMGVTLYPEKLTEVHSN